MADYLELVKKLRNYASFTAIPPLSVDLSEAADAIEQLQKDLERSKEYEAFWEKEASEALRRFQVAIASKPQWIPVTERLPDVEEDVNVAVLTSIRGKRIRTVTTDYINTAGMWDAASCDWRHEVTHWMPLPDPPKEET